MPIQEFTCLLCGARKYRDTAIVRPRNVVCIPCHAFMDRTAVLPDDAPVSPGETIKKCATCPRKFDLANPIDAAIWNGSHRCAE